MECLAIIPARGGSKGIPRKNLYLLDGRPLVAHSIEQALLARYVNRVVVSTDDPEIGAVSKQYGAEVVWRPTQISGDQASSEAALLHVLETLKKEDGYNPDLLVFLQCTAPLTLALDIDGTVQTLLDEKADSAFAAARSYYFLWRTETDEDGNINAVGINHDKRIRQLRQEREPQYIETGAVYAMHVPGFLASGHRFFGKTALYEMPIERGLDIDELVDLKVAEVILREQNRPRKRTPELPELVQALIMNFDGVFTDNRVIIFPDGGEGFLYDRSDGTGIAQLKKTSLPILILSSETNPAVQAHADKLGIECIQELENKWQALRGWLNERNLDPRHVVYVGNDKNDLQCMKNVGFSAATASAQAEILQQADLILRNSGGYGAIREICEMIIDQVI